MIFEDMTPEYFARVQSLQYLDNKEDFLQHGSSFIISKNLQLIIPYLEQDQFCYYISSYGYYMTIRFSNGKNYTIYNTNYGLNRGTTQRIFTDKVITAEFLQYNNLPTPQHYLLLDQCSSLSSSSNNATGAFVFAEKIGYPLFFKPVKGSFGVGVKKVYSHKELQDAIDCIEQSHPYMLQQPCAGKHDYRVLYLNGEVLAAYEREYPSVVGNGKDTIEQLIANHKAYIINSNNVVTYLQQQGYTLTTILSEGLKIELLPTANIATGGSVRLYGDLSQADYDFIKRISDATGSSYFGADILTDGTLAEGTILELNSTPGTDGIREFDPAFASYFGTKIRNAIKESEGL